MIVQGVQDMVNALGGLPVANVVLAAGVTGNTNQAQLNYEIGIVANVRSMCPGARVVWPRRRQTMCGALAIACRCRKRLVCWTILRAVSWVPGTCSMALRSTIISSDSARRLIPAAPLWQGPETAEARAECPV